MKDRIKEILDSQGLNATQFAQKVNINVSALSHILSGRNNPSYDALQKIIVHSQDFVSSFGSLDGRRLRTAPKGFPADFPGMDYLKFKDYTATHKLSALEMERSDFCEYIAGLFQHLYPLNRFLNFALDEYKENKPFYNHPINS
jgi:transcriptional regulator with XRE-family HTH domain